MATNIMKTMTHKKIKPKSKSTKDKMRNIHLQVADHTVTISNPSTAVVKTAGEGLYIKLTQHQRNIAQQLKFITSALENGNVQYRSRHNKTDLTKVITALLVQLDCAVTTTYQCFTKNALDGNNSFKSRLDQNETLMYDSTAVLVRWIDFESKDNSLEKPQDREKIMATIGKFELALAEVVRVVYECQLMNSAGGEGPFATSTLPAKRRASSVETSTLPGFHHKRPGGDNELLHPALHSLREENKDRKISWSPGMGGHAQVPLPVYRGGGLAIQSEGSSTSDEEKRRSGSTERYPSSPEHQSRSTGSMSPDWDSRLRSQTVPIDSMYSTVSSHPVPVPTPTIPDNTSSLPPLPGEEVDGPPPPLPRRGEEQDEQTTSTPRTKGFTLPRMSQPNLDVNGRFSPDATFPSSDAPVETPPPLPAKKRHTHQTHPSQVNGHTLPSSQNPPDNDELPPPLPVKQRRSTTAGQDSPSQTPTHTPSHNLHRTPVTADMLSRSLDFSLEGGVRMGKELPPVPMRIESIPGVKSALVQESPPPKPPRTDRPPDVPSPLHTPLHHPQPRPSISTPTSKQEEVFNAVRKYNEDVIKARDSGPDQAPPVPLKKKTVLLYKNLIQGYTYDESLMQPLYIPGMEAPPPLPPKKRRRRRQQTPGNGAPADNSMAPGGGKAGQGMDPKPNTVFSHDSLNASTEEIEELEEGADVNYLECEDASGYLIFNREDDGGYTLMGGPIDALIAYAASNTKAVLRYSEAFLLTYSTFITPGELIKKLLYRLEHFYRSKTRAVWESTTSLLVRVLTGLKQPLTQEAQIQLIDMVHRMITNGNLKFAQLLRNALVEKLNQLFPDLKSSIPLGIALSARTKLTRNLSIQSFTPDDLARQMTILDNELFQKVDVCEMLYFAKDQNEEKSPMLTQFTMHFNNVSQWTKVTLLKRGIDMKARCKLMMHFVTIMKCLREKYNNFNSYLAVLSAIESAPMTRLDWTDKILKALEEPRQLIDNRGSFKNYREAFARAKPPCIPYIGLYLQDLTFIEMQPSKLKEGEGINFTKRWKQFKSVDHIRFAQTKQYMFDPDPEILSLFCNFEVEQTDEDLWAISNEIKPSARALRSMAASST